jgi:hypothetical protein
VVLFQCTGATPILLARFFICEPMTTHDLEIRLAALKKQKLELSAEIQQASRSRSKLAHSANYQKETLANLILELGSTPMAEASEIVVPPQLADHKMKAHVLALYELSGYSTDAVTSWLLGHGKWDRGGHRHSPGARSSTSAGVEWLYIRTPQQELDAALDSIPNDRAGLGRHVVEHRLFHWLVKQNCDVGINPQTSQFLAEAVRCVPSALPSFDQERLRTFFEVRTRKTQRWLASFRIRWDVKDGMLVPGEMLEPIVMAEKVSWAALIYIYIYICFMRISVSLSTRPWLAKIITLLGPDLDKSGLPPHSGAHFWPRKVVTNFWPLMLPSFSRHNFCCFLWVQLVDSSRICVILLGEFTDPFLGPQSGPIFGAAY